MMAVFVEFQVCVTRVGGRNRPRPGRSSCVTQGSFLSLSDFVREMGDVLSMSGL